MKQDITALLEKAQTTSELTQEELVSLLSLDETQIPQLLAAADAVRHKTVGDQVHLRGIIEFSSHCKQHCCYCGLRLITTRFSVIGYLQNKFWKLPGLLFR